MPSVAATLDYVRRWDPRVGRRTYRWVSVEEGPSDEGMETSGMDGEGEEGEAAREVDVKTMHGRACRAFLRLGGHRMLTRTIGRSCKEQAERRTEELRLGLANFQKFGSCSEQAPRKYSDSEDEKIVVEISKRVRATRVDKEWAAGNKADSRGRWAAESIMGARRRANRRGWELLLVEWVGGHEPCWVRLGDLDRFGQEPQGGGSCRES